MHTGQTITRLPDGWKPTLKITVTETFGNVINYDMGTTDSQESSIELIASWIRQGGYRSIMLHRVADV